MTLVLRRSTLENREMDNILSITPFDFHLHSRLSHDGGAGLGDYCRLAVDKGMRAIGFCEHVDLDPRDFVSGRHDYGRYWEEIAAARSEFGDRLLILMGAEVGFVPRIQAEIAEHLRAHEYDYVVGAVHTVFDGESGISDEYEALETFARYELMSVYENYFETVSQMVKSGLFDVVGHLDLIQRFGVNYLREGMEWGRFYGALRRIFEGAIKRQMAIELNTSGLRQPPRELYPCPAILALYREVGGGYIIAGSDAHQPADLGAGIPVAIKRAADQGLDQFVIYRRRLPELIDWRKLSAATG